MNLLSVILEQPFRSVVDPLTTLRVKYKIPSTLIQPKHDSSRTSSQNSPRAIGHTSRLRLKRIFSSVDDCRDADASSAKFLANQG